MSDAAPAGERALLDALATGELRPVGLLHRASNESFLAELIADGRRSLCVYKPAAGEAPLWDFPAGSLAGREVAAYEVARSLGWPGVPPTMFRDGPMGPGAVQAFVEADPRQHFFTLRQHRLEEFETVAAFDVVANNADRKAGHCLLDPDGTIWVIDHGLCFHAEPKLRTVIWDFAGERLSEALRDDLHWAAGDLRRGELGERLGGLLRPEEVEATARRADALASSGRFPHPGPGRAVPWPPV